MLINEYLIQDLRKRLVFRFGISVTTPPRSCFPAQPYRGKQAIIHPNM